MLIALCLLMRCGGTLIWIVVRAVGDVDADVVTRVFAVVVCLVMVFDGYLGGLTVVLVAFVGWLRSMDERDHGVVDDGACFGEFDDCCVGFVVGVRGRWRRSEEFGNDWRIDVMQATFFSAVQLVLAIPVEGAI